MTTIVENIVVKTSNVIKSSQKNEIISKFILICKIKKKNKIKNKPIALECYII